MCSNSLISLNTKYVSTNYSVAQLVDQSLPTPEVFGPHRVIGKICIEQYLVSTVLKLFRTSLRSSWEQSLRMCWRWHYQIWNWKDYQSIESNFISCLVLKHAINDDKNNNDKTTVVVIIIFKMLKVIRNRKIFFCFLVNHILLFCIKIIILS